MAKARIAAVPDRELPDAVQERLAQIRALKPNWDSYGSEAISPDAIELCKSVIVLARKELRAAGVAGLEPFTIVPDPEGGVQVEWRGPLGELEVEISPEQTITTLLVQGSGDGRTFVETADADWDAVRESLLKIVG